MIAKPLIHRRKWFRFFKGIFIFVSPFLIFCFCSARSVNIMVSPKKFTVVSPATSDRPCSRSFGLGINVDTTRNHFNFRVCNFSVAPNEFHRNGNWLLPLAPYFGSPALITTFTALKILYKDRKLIWRAFFGGAIQPIDSKEERLSMKLQPRKVRSERASNQTTSQSLERHNVQ